MAESRRSGRSRKQVDYAKFGDDHDVMDDDFAESTPPPTKRSKLSNKDTKSKKEKKDKVPKAKKSPKKSPKKNERSSLDEKLYERDLQAALQLSMVDSQSQGDGKCLNDDSDGDKIELLEEGIDVDDTGDRKKPRRAAAKQPIIDDGDENDEEIEEDAIGRQDDRIKVEDEAVESDEEFDLDDDGDDDEYEDDNDSDFEGPGSRKKSKRSKSKKKSQPTAISPSKPKPRMSVTVTPVNKGRGKTTPKTSTPKMSSFSSYGSEASSSTHRASSSGGVLHIRKPNWCPPGPAGSSRDGVTSPGSGGLRLGLSKKIKVKSLHPSVKVPN